MISPPSFGTPPELYRELRFVGLDCSSWVPNSKTGFRIVGTLSWTVVSGWDSATSLDQTLGYETSIHKFDQQERFICLGSDAFKVSRAPDKTRQ